LHDRFAMVVNREAGGAVRQQAANGELHPRYDEQLATDRSGHDQTYSLEKQQGQEALRRTRQGWAVQGHPTIFARARLRHQAREQGRSSGGGEEGGKKTAKKATKKSATKTARKAAKKTTRKTTGKKSTRKTTARKTARKAAKHA
jgi:hypothetical protein